MTIVTEVIIVTSVLIIVVVVLGCQLIALLMKWMLLWQLPPHQLLQTAE